MLNQEEYRVLCELIDGSGNEDMTSLRNIAIINQLMSRGLIEIGFRPSRDGHEQIAWFEECSNQVEDDHTNSSAAKSKQLVSDEEYRECLIRALSHHVPHWGKKTAVKVVDKFNTLENILDIKNGEACSLLGAKAIGLIKFLNDEYSIERVKERLSSLEKSKEFEALAEARRSKIIKRYEEAVGNA